MVALPTSAKGQSRVNRGQTRREQQRTQDMPFHGLNNLKRQLGLDSASSERDREYATQERVTVGRFWSCTGPRN